MESGGRKSCRYRHRFPELNDARNGRGLPVLLDGGDLSGKVRVPRENGGAMMMTTGEDIDTGLELTSLVLPQQLLLELLPLRGHVAHVTWLPDAG